MAQLPQDLIVETLLRLPVKSLLRFRCLFKSFCEVIDNPNFSKSHLCKSSQNFNLRKLIFSDGPVEKFHVCDVNIDLEKEEILRLEKPVSISSLWKEICGNCKGLILFSRKVSIRILFSLWNPSTRQYRVLPDCPFKQPDSFFGIIGSGLGYDDSTDDFKAIVMVKVPGKLRNEVQVWIYSLKLNIWSRAPNFPSLGDSAYQIEDFRKMGLYYADGSLNWIRTRFRNGEDNRPVDMRREIVAFDVGKETFSLVPLPAICSTEVFLKLHVLEDCLCISYFHISTSLADLYIREGWS